ncbi:MAG TPA: efflux transporter outer membrane subunit [Caulobacteraceae bacterium]|nr:efflux transporter outer membrane subunit [Caulobacteraceae bacterium]
MTAPRLAAGLAAVSLAACTVGPNYHRPDIPTPAAFVEPGAAAPASEADLTRWWAAFHDPVLDDLIRRAVAANLDLAAAASRVRQSRFEEKVTGAAEWPAINAAANTVALQSNRSASSGPPTGFQLPASLNLYSVGFDATWEVDLFGGTRRAIQEAKANSEAAVWARRGAEVTLISELANDYLTLRAVQARIAVGEAELARQRDLFALVAARRQAGFVTGLDVNQQTGVVATAAAQIHQLEAEERVQIHALAVLLGEPPETLEPTLARRTRALPRSPPVLPAGLPADLLRRRPDLREAERRLAAANAEIGVQTANLYPRLNLIGLGSFAGTSLGDLFSAQNLSGVGVGLLTAPLFNAGKTHAAIGAAREKDVQAELAWRGAFLASLREVEDALARYRAEEARRAQLETAVTAAAGSLAIARDQYQVGLATYINVYAAENALLNARDQLVQSQAQSDTDLVALYKALGGGWVA